MIRLLPFIAALVIAPHSSFAEQNARCDIGQTPIVSLEYDSRYQDGDVARATIDTDKDSEADAALAPLDAFIDQLAVKADELNTGPGRSRLQAAECILDQLASWAAADALSDLRTQTVKLTIGARLSGFSLILWQTKPYLPNHPQRQQIEDWLTRRLADQIKFWADAPSGARKGNLRAWASLAAAATAQQTDNATLRKWASAGIEEVVCSSQSDGSLPQEMSRGAYALHYQLYAISPLVTATVLLERQGVKAAQFCGGALHNIVEFASRDLIDGAQSEKLSGSAQTLFDGTSDIMNFQLAWIEQYLVLRQSDFLDAIAQDRRPLIFSKLGGNQTALWGAAQDQ